MGRTLVFLVGFLLAALLVNTLQDGAVAADTPVEVLPVENIILRLPVSPSVDRITGDLKLELERMAGVATDSRLVAALERMAADPRLLQSVATTPVEMFDNGQAVATATAVYDIELDPDLVTVVVGTVELVPGYGATASSRDHEDGHALINKTMAQRCAASGLAAAVGDGLRGDHLINRLIIYLSEASDPAHAVYHTYVGRAGYGQHIRYAEKALDEVTTCP